jgi:predicted transcriptional regulator
MLRDLVNRAFNGSAAAAALHLIETSELSDRELVELRTLLTRKMKEE